MARALRIEIPGGRYHITAQGNERRAIFRQDTDRIRLLELLSELPARFGVRLHAYVLMSNHDHLVMETPEANLSRATQWLNVSYSVWFNRRHRRSGHLSPNWTIIMNNLTPPNGLAPSDAFPSWHSVYKGSGNS